MNILTLDLGSKTGWAFSTGKNILSGTQEFKPQRFEGGGMRYLRFRKWLSEITAHEQIEAVYFEEVRRHLSTDAAHAYGGFLAVLTEHCENYTIPYIGVPAGTIKKHITGKGNAGKEAVIDAIVKRGHSPADDNEADALAIMAWVIDTNQLQDLQA